MKKLLLIALMASALLSATYDTNYGHTADTKKVKECKEGFELKEVQTNITHYAYQEKQYAKKCVEIKKGK